MKVPAQRPPEGDSSSRPGDRADSLERVGKAIAELGLLALSALAGMSAVLVLMLLGVLPNPEAEPWSGIIQGPILLGTAGLSYLVLERALARDGDPPRPLDVLGGRRRAGVTAGLLIAVGAIVVAMVGSMLLALAQELALSIEVEEQQTILELVERGDPFELTVLAVSAVILAPLTEELLFRHMLFRRLWQRAGPIAAWTLPALAFALAHYNLVGLVIYMWLGSVFALAYALSGRLWVAALAHAGHNAVALTMLVYAPDVLP